MTTGRINQIAFFFFFFPFLPSSQDHSRAPTHDAATPIVASSPATRAGARTAGRRYRDGSALWLVGWSVGRFLSLSLSLSLFLPLREGAGRATPPPPSPSPSLKYPHSLPSAGMSIPTRGALTGRRRWAAAVTGPPIAPIGTVLGTLRLAWSQPPRAGAPCAAHRCLWIRWFALVLPVSEADRLRKPHLVSSLTPGSHAPLPRAGALASPTCFASKHTEPVPRRSRGREGPVHPLGTPASRSLACKQLTSGGTYIFSSRDPLEREREREREGAEAAGDR